MDSTSPELLDEALSLLAQEAQPTAARARLPAADILRRVREFDRYYRALAERPTGAALLYRRPGSTEVRAQLVGQKLTVGRQSARCDLALADDAALSRAHFEITCEDGLCVLRDLNSLHGTFVNGAEQPVLERELVPGDIIHAGDTHFIFCGA